MSAYTQHCISTMSPEERQRQRAHLHLGVQCANIGQLVQQQQQQQQRMQQQQHFDVDDDDRAP
jgi:hypothetical protein